MPLGKSVSSRGASGSLLKADDMGKCEVCEGSIEGSITPGTLDTSWPWISLRIPTDTASVFSASSDDASEVSTPRREDVTPRGVQGLQWPESASDRLESDIEDDMFVLSPTPSQVPSLQDELDPGGPHLPPWNAQRFRFWKVHMMAARSGGQVELYYDLMTGGSVAVKHLPRSRLRDSPQSYQEAWPGEVENPWKEIEIMMRFGMPGPEQLPGVCRSLGAFRTESGDGMLVSEYLPGGDLFDIAAKLGEPGYDREQHVYPIVISLIQAVRALHVRGIAHGDISLENALLRYGSQVVLIDFAMAVTENVEMATGHRGKPSYMAPEMFVQQSYDALAADVFSCGVCAYALAMGSYPWSSTRPNACLAFMFAQRFGLTELLQRRRLATSNRQRVPIASCMTPGFHQILAGMLKMDPAKRPKFHHLDWVQKYGDAFGW